MGLGTIFGFHNPKTTDKERLCKFAQPGLSCNSRGSGGIGLDHKVFMNVRTQVFNVKYALRGDKSEKLDEERMIHFLPLQRAADQY